MYYGEFRPRVGREGCIAGAIDNYCVDTCLGRGFGFCVGKVNGEQVDGWDWGVMQNDGSFFGREGGRR